MEKKLLKLDSLESATLSLSGKLSKVQSRMETISGQMSNFSIELSKLDKKWEIRTADLSAKVSKLEGDRGRLKSDWAAYKGSLNKDLSQINKNGELQSNKIKDLENQVSKFKEKLSSIANLEEKLAATEQLAIDLKKKMDSLCELEDKIKQATNDKFEELKAAIKKEVRAEVIHEFRINQRAANAEVRYDVLRGEAFAKRHNLIICSLPETEAENGDFQGVKDFFKNSMDLPNIRIQEVYRLGNISEGSSYTRPLVVRFPQVKDRWKVWNKRTHIKCDNNSPIWIQQDLPKQLRDDLRILNRVAKMARLQPSKYNDVKVKDFKLHINGRVYVPNNLRQLPSDLQPEGVYTPRSDSSVVFFTKQSPLSNHHQSRFTLDGVTYSCVEQCLAHHKASIMGDNALANQALQSDNPADHKIILNMLKKGN